MNRTSIEWVALRGHGEFPAEYTGSRTVAELNALFDACFRIQREASEAAGRYIPLIVENVRGAQPWVGKAKAEFGSFMLWGDVRQIGRKIVSRLDWEHAKADHSFKMPYLLAPERTQAQKRNPDGTDHGSGSWFKIADSKNRGAHTKNEGGSWFAVAHNTESGYSNNPVSVSGGFKQSGISGERTNGKGDKWFQDGAARHGSKSNSRKAASAQIAEIPYPLARYIASCFRGN